MPSNDSQLIIDYLDGDEQAFVKIIDRYTNPIFNFLFQFCRNKEESNDLTQEVFLKVWKNLKKFDAEKNFKTWIFSIARNTAIDWMRKKKDYNFSQLDTQSETSFEEKIPDLEALPDEIFERKELKMELDSALSKLSAEDRTIIVLYHTEELTFEEIAQVVSKPMNTVKSQYRRALSKLRGYLV